MDCTYGLNVYVMDCTISIRLIDGFSGKEDYHADNSSNPYVYTEQPNPSPHAVVQQKSNAVISMKSDHRQLTNLPACSTQLETMRLESSKLN